MRAPSNEPEVIVVAGRLGMSAKGHSAAVLIMDFANVVLGSILEEGSVGILSDDVKVPVVILAALLAAARSSSLEYLIVILYMYIL